MRSWRALARGTRRTLIALAYPIAIGLVLDCASVKTNGVNVRDSASDLGPVSLAGHSGARRRIQVLRLGVPKEIVEQYKELADKRVGYGLSNRILEALYETGRFDFVEDKDSVLKKMADQWKMSDAGLVSEQTRVAAGSLTAPEFLAYAEVFDFSVTRKEQIAVVATERKNTTIIGVQIRLVDVRTGEFIVGSGQGDATTTTMAIWVNPTTVFDQTTVGIATRRAVNVALDQLLRRAMARGVF